MRGGGQLGYHGGMLQTGNKATLARDKTWMGSSIARVCSCATNCKHASCKNALINKAATKPMFFMGIACGAFALAGIALWIWHRFGPDTYIRTRTKFGKTRIYEVADENGASVRLLEVGGIVQSGTYVDDSYTKLVFEYLKRYDMMFDMQHDIKRVCVLGCGGYDYPEHLIAHHESVVVDAVEVDPAITSLARRYFFLDRLIAEYDTAANGRLNLICDDALSFLENTTQRYDAIVNDAFDAGTPPDHLTTREFAQAVHARLQPEGVFLTNIVSPLEGPQSTFLHDQAKMLSTVFKNVRVFPCDADSLTEADNVIVMASDATLPISYNAVQA